MLRKLVDQAQDGTRLTLIPMHPINALTEGYGPSRGLSTTLTSPRRTQHANGYDALASRMRTSRWWCRSGRPTGGRIGGVCAPSSERSTRACGLPPMTALFGEMTSSVNQRTCSRRKSVVTGRAQSRLVTRFAREPRGAPCKTSQTRLSKGARRGGGSEWNVSFRRSSYLSLARPMSW